MSKHHLRGHVQPEWYVGEGGLFVIAIIFLIALVVLSMLISTPDSHAWADSVHATATAVSKGTP